MKRDIFNGKIKKEYFSYILIYMIFFVLLFVGIGGLCIYASIHEMTINTSGERLLVAALGGIFFVLAVVYLFLELLVIRRFPKYEKLRRSLFNSDIYLTDSTSNEYFGRTGTLRGRRNKAAFDLVTTVAELEAGMGDKKPIQYKVYNILSILMSVSGLILMIALPILYMNGVIRPIMSQNAFVLSCAAAGIVCVAIAIFFFSRAFETALMAPLEKNKWRSDLYTSLIDISVRQNNKKLKYWFDTD